MSEHLSQSVTDEQLDKWEELASFRYESPRAWPEHEHPLAIYEREFRQAVPELIAEVRQFRGGSNVTCTT